MNEFPKRILAKKVKGLNTIIYFIEFESTTNRVRTQWIEITKLGNYLDMIEQFETRNHINYMELYSDIIENDNEYEQIRLQQTIKIQDEQIHKNNITDVFLLQKIPNDEFVYKMKKEGNEQIELNKELKNITKSFQRGGSRVSFTPEQITKIITYAKDELDNNKYMFLIEWKPRESGNIVRPSWVGQEKMQCHAPELLERYANEKGFRLN